MAIPSRALRARVRACECVCFRGPDHIRCNQFRRSSRPHQPAPPARRCTRKVPAHRSSDGLRLRPPSSPLQMHIVGRCFWLPRRGECCSSSTGLRAFLQPPRVSAVARRPGASRSSFPRPGCGWWSRPEEKRPGGALVAQARGKAGNWIGQTFGSRWQSLVDRGDEPSLGAAQTSRDPTTASGPRARRPGVR